MGGKQKEGDSQQRRARARRAREEGHAPSEAGVTLGASKQREHEEHANREGPQPVGTRKPMPHDPIEPRRPPPEGELPHWRPEAFGATPDGEQSGIRYRDVVAEVARRTGLDFDQARLATEAVVTVLARALDMEDRQRLLRAVPAELRAHYAINVPYVPVSVTGFLDQVATIVHRPPEQARYQAEAALSAIADQDRSVVESLRLPDYIEELIVPSPPGGGIVGVDGGTPPLTDDELRDALAKLPLWSGSREVLTRSITLPPDLREQLLHRLARLKRELGRGPHIAGEGDTSVVLSVRTSRVRAVTALDVELARRVDSVVEEVVAT